MAISVTLMAISTTLMAIGVTLMAISTTLLAIGVALMAISMTLMAIGVVLMAISMTLLAFVEEKMGRKLGIKLFFVRNLLPKQALAFLTVTYF